MKATYHPAEVRNFVLRGVALLACLIALSGPTLRAAPGAPQGCHQGIASLNVNKGSVIALAAGPDGTATLEEGGNGLVRVRARRWLCRGGSRTKAVQISQGPRGFAPCYAERLRLSGRNLLFFFRRRKAQPSRGGKQVV